MIQEYFINIITPEERYQWLSLIGHKDSCGTEYAGDEYLHKLSAQKYHRQYISKRFAEHIPTSTTSMNRKRRALLCHR